MRPRGESPTVGTLAPGIHQTAGDKARIDECIFCSKPALGDDAAALIAHRGERCFVMLNAFPYTSGHVMVAPYEHTARPGRARPADRRRADAPHPALAARARAAPTARGLQRRREPGQGRRRRRGGPRPPARRAALGGRHELHAGRGRHAWCCPESLEESYVAQAARRRSRPAEADDSRRSRTSSRPTTSGACTRRRSTRSRLPGRRARSPACSRISEGAPGGARSGLRMAVGHDMRLHSPALAPHFARGLTDEGCDVLDIGMVGHGDGLLRRRLARPGRRRLGDRLAQPQGLGRLQARARGGDRRSRATGGSRTCAAWSRAEDFSRRPGRGAVDQGGHLRGVPPPRARLHRSRRDPAHEGRARRRQRDGRGR